MLPNRWSQSRLAWDSLGVLSRASYRPDGLVSWTEGKTGDSSRVYFHYDARQRLVKRYHLRSASDTFRLDSLLYDASHRVTAAVSSSALTQYYSYDGNGNVAETWRVPAERWKYWYRSDGLLDSVRGPGQTIAIRHTYEGTWKNLWKITLESGEVVTQRRRHRYGVSFQTKCSRRRGRKLRERPRIRKVRIAKRPRKLKSC